VNWLWLNVPLMAVFFLAMTGVPLWLVCRHPDAGPATAPVRAARPRAPSAVTGRDAHARELAGVGR
jgi:hypothetical protein